MEGLLKYLLIKSSLLGRRFYYWRVENGEIVGEVTRYTA